MEHYFIEKEMLPENEREIMFLFKGAEIKFKTNSGLFSYKEVDYASALLMETIPPLKGALLDMGCGYGAIGISLAKVYPLDLTLCDVNAAALRYAEINAGINKITAKLVHSDGFDGVGESFDAIIANPPIHAGKDTVFKIYEQAAKHLNPSGAFYMVVQKKHGAESHLKKLDETFGTVEVLYKKKGYYVVRSCPREAAPPA